MNGLMNDEMDALINQYICGLIDGRINDYTTRFGIDPVPIAKRLQEQTRPLDFEGVR